jgi:hypothetical protein
VIAAFWPYLLGGVVLVFIAGALLLEWLGRRDAHAQELRDEARRQAHLDAIVRGRDGLR